MNKRKICMSLFALGLAATALVGCSSNDAVRNDTAGESGAAQSEAGSSMDAQALGPIIKDPTTLDGATVTLPSERHLVLNVPEDSDVTKWSATIEDASVAEFVAGTDDGSMVTNPGISPLAVTEGTTVTLTDPEGQAVTFTLIITEGSR
ncbi:hypothetical protein [Schaalia vaccimaxillae]|uniref:hypothetical protein n=1 Tax=Schaalia vaccimaxillae TaxID=183916 RepID=UPI00103B6078|nr:hypothetical protein [Schaalia vaccimaxillae]